MCSKCLGHPKRTRAKMSKQAMVRGHHDMETGK